jgi:hypothetical protein
LYLIGYEIENRNALAPTKPVRTTYSQAPSLAP